jgi:hypothetical protein
MECPNCWKPLLTAAQVRILTRTVGIKRKKLVCQACKQSYHLTVAVTAEGHLLHLSEKQTNIYRLFQRLQRRGSHIEEIHRQAEQTQHAMLVLGKKNHRHYWVFSEFHERNLIVRCTECQAKKLVTSKKASTLMQYVFVPVLEGAKFNAQERKTINSFFLPNKTMFLNEIKKEVESQLKGLQEKRRRLKQLDKMCNVLATAL